MPRVELEVWGRKSLLFGKIRDRPLLETNDNSTRVNLRMSLASASNQKVQIFHVSAIPERDSGLPFEIEVEYSVHGPDVIG